MAQRFRKKLIVGTQVFPSLSFHTETFNKGKKVNTGSMKKRVTLGLIQTKVSTDPEANLKKTVKMNMKISHVRNSRV